MTPLQTQVTLLLSAAAGGDASAAERLMRVVYDELHQLAKAQLAHERRRGDLQTTVLVQEVYLRLLAGKVGHGNGGNSGNGSVTPENRRQFFACAANSMRQFLVDHARKRDRLKRGGGRAAAEWNDDAVAVEFDADEVIAVDDALEKLAKLDPQAVELVKLRYFAGLSIDETAEVLGVSPRQVDKMWQYARSWLKREIG